MLLLLLLLLFESGAQCVRLDAVCLKTVRSACGLGAVKNSSINVVVTAANISVSFLSVVQSIFVLTSVVREGYMLGIIGAGAEWFRILH